MTDYAKKSLEGLWVGDCVGNLGQLYFAHDILKALSEGVAKFGGQLSQFRNQFQYSDDTEEAIVLYNHLKMAVANTVADDVAKKVTDAGTTIHCSVKTAFEGKSIVNQDKLAMDFATRYMDRDPDGEIYGYGLNTRKVLRDIYDGMPWRDANKIIKKAEGMPSHIDSLVGSLSAGKGFKDAIVDVKARLAEQRQEQLGMVKEGSCGNGSAMRVAPLGAFLASQWDKPGDWKRVVAEAALQAEPTHCHPEGIAGAIAISVLAHSITELTITKTKYGPEVANDLYRNLLHCTPQGQVWNGISKAKDLPLDTPIGKVREILGNGTHVTCQDTVPFCCFMAIKYFSTYINLPEMYEKAIIETSMAFGDVDTNCAIVGGLIGIVCPPPEKWSQFCQPMEGVVC